MDYIGLDVHKKTISYCVKKANGRVRAEGTIPATRSGLAGWVRERRRPWLGAMEATLSTGWVYEALKPSALALKVGHPLMLRAIVAAKKKSEALDAAQRADLLRCALVPECYIAPELIRELRRALRFRKLMLEQAVRMKNKIAGLLMEVGEPYNKGRLHGKRYFAELLDSLEARTPRPDLARPPPDHPRADRGGDELGRGSSSFRPGLANLGLRPAPLRAAAANT